MNYAARGFPVGFTTPPANGMGPPDMHVYNHLAFTISYLKDPDSDESEGSVRITGFDAHPISIQHEGHVGESVTTCTGSSYPQNNPR
eukprot:12241478-Ditylum_brightwellii.AAC.1